MPMRRRISDSPIFTFLCDHGIEAGGRGEAGFRQIADEGATLSLQRHTCAAHS